MAPLAYPDLTSRHQLNQHLFRQMLSQPPADNLPSFSAVACPTLILWGDCDRVIHSSCADTYQRLIPQAQVKYLRGIGHMPMVEAPRLTARLLHRFVRAQQPSSALSTQMLCEAS
jgi:pimeloyl-ACP methyl ester carboxylesterase